MRNRLLLPFLPALLLLPFLAACSNSSDAILTGTAAAGAPIEGTVTVAGANDRTAGPIAIDPDGSFTVNVEDLTLPFLIEVVGTANGQNVHLFTASTEVGRVNVTPMTHAATRAALGSAITSITQDIPTDIDVDNVARNIAQIVQPILEQMGVQADVDLLHGVFEANGVGIDLLMDLASFEVNTDGDIEMLNRGMEDDPSTPNVNESMMGEVPHNGPPVQPTPDELTAFLTSRTVLSRARTLATAIEGLFATSDHPSAQEIESALNTLDNATFLESGRDFSALKTHWADPTSRLPFRRGVKIPHIGLLRPMELESLDQVYPDLLQQNEVEDGDVGMWVVLHVQNGANVHDHLAGFVRNSTAPGNTGTSWSWSGNGIPFEKGGDIASEAIKNITPQETGYSSGYTMALQGNASSHTIDAVYVVNGVFPEGAVDGDPERHIRLIVNPDDAAAPWIVDTDLAHLEVSDADYNRYVKPLEEADLQGFSPEVLFVATHGSASAISWPGFLPGPYEPRSYVTENQATLFASLETLNGQSAATATANALVGSNPSTLAITWTTPEMQHVVEVEAAFTTSGSTESVIAFNPNTPATAPLWNATTFDLSGVTTGAGTELAIRIRSRHAEGMIWTTLHHIP